MDTVLKSSTPIKMVVMTKLDGSSKYLETTNADKWLKLIKDGVDLALANTGIITDHNPSGVKSLSITYMDDTVISLVENEVDVFFKTANGCLYMQQMRRGRTYDFPQWKRCN